MAKLEHCVPRQPAECKDKGATQTYMWTKLRLPLCAAQQIVKLPEHVFSSTDFEWWYLAHELAAKIKRGHFYKAPGTQGLAHLFSPKSCWGKRDTGIHNKVAHLSNTSSLILVTFNAENKDNSTDIIITTLCNNGQIRITYKIIRLSLLLTYKKHLLWKEEQSCFKVSIRLSYQSSHLRHSYRINFQTLFYFLKYAISKL